MSTQKSLIDLQKETFLELKNEISEQRRDEDTKTTKYRNIYLDEVSNYASISSKSDLFEDLKDAKIIYCGDFHTLKRSQYSALKILLYLIEQGIKVTIALEMIPTNFQNIANDFVRKRVSEKEFLEKIDYEKIWGFPWKNYKPLFEFANKNRAIILGLNSENGESSPLPVRDQIAAEKIVSHMEKYPDRVVFCLYGDLHIANKHIPKKVEELLGKKKLGKIKTLRVFQNSDEIYFKLLDQNLAHQVDVVKISSNSYCILSSTPWIKWQSYLSWVEERSSLLEEKDEDTFGYFQLPDFFHEIRDFSQKILEFLKHELPPFDDFEVYTPFDTKVADKIDQYFQSLEQAPKKAIQKILEAEMIENRSLLIPDQSVIYLLDFTQNRAVEKAAQLVATRLSKQLCIYGKDFDEKEIFYRLLLWEAIGYFGSKIINPKRKCDQYKDFEKRLEQFQRKKTKGIQRDEKLVAQEVLKHRAFEISRLETNQNHPPKKMFGFPPKLFFLCARSLGRILGDQLYSKVIDDRVSLKVVQHLFTSLSVKNSAKKIYWELASQIKSHQHEPRMSKDELF